MDSANRLHRLKLLRDRHKLQHKTVEVLEAEKAPADIVAKAKKMKLSMKDEIAALETALKAEGTNIDV